MARNTSTRERPRGPLTRFGILSMTLSLGLAVSSATSAYAKPGGGKLDDSSGSSTPAVTSTGGADLKAAHVGASNPGFTTGSCPEHGGDWGWHFVLQGNNTEFVTITATFDKAGPVSTFISQPTGKHAYVFTPAADNLLGATATTTGTGTLDTEFVLSHVCAGDSGTPVVLDSTPTPTPTATATPTSTVVTSVTTPTPAAATPASTPTATATPTSTVVTSVTTPTPASTTPASTPTPVASTQPPTGTQPPSPTTEATPSSTATTPSDPPSDPPLVISSDPPTSNPPAVNTPVVDPPVSNLPAPDKPAVDKPVDVVDVTAGAKTPGALPIPGVPATGNTVLRAAESGSGLPALGLFLTGIGAAAMVISRKKARQ